VYNVIKPGRICKHVEEDDMIDNVAADAIMSAGMKCLVEKLGTVEAEIFISIIRENTFDYTEWRRSNLWQNMSINEIFELAAEREKVDEVKYIKKSDVPDPTSP